MIAWISLLTPSSINLSPQIHPTFPHLTSPRDEYGGHWKAPLCTRTHTHYIISWVKNTVIQYLEFPLGPLEFPPTLRSTLGFGPMIHWGQERLSGDMSSITGGDGEGQWGGWGGRSGDGGWYVGRRTGGRGFCWSLTVHNATATDRVEMLRQGLGGAE